MAYQMSGCVAMVCPRYCGRIRSMENYDKSVLHIFSRDVLRRIKESDPTWEQMVPASVVTAIKKRGLFGYAATPSVAAVAN